MLNKNIHNCDKKLLYRLVQFCIINRSSQFYKALVYLTSSTSPLNSRMVIKSSCNFLRLTQILDIFKTLLSLTLKDIKIFSSNSRYGKTGDLTNNFFPIIILFILFKVVVNQQLYIGLPHALSIPSPQFFSLKSILIFFPKKIHSEKVSFI